MRFKHLSRFLLAATTVLGACSDDNGTNGSDVGTLTVRLTDAPGEEIESAVIWVSGVSIIGSDESVHVINTDDASYDLLDFQGGASALLGSAEIPVGTYNQLRLIVDSAQVTLKAPVTFTDGSSTASLKVPSGSESGLKINLDNVEIIPGETVLLVDFDVSRSFVFQGPPGGPKSAIFKPVIHATVMDVAGSISGTVTPASALAGLYAIQGADTIATAAADPATGAYTIHFLPPGEYTVLARADGYQDAVVTGVTVGNSQDVTGVDFTLTVAAAPGSISGTVTPAASAATLYAVQGLDTIGTALADPTTGAYSLLALPPGTYSVVAKASGYVTASMDNVLVGDGQAVVGIDFTLIPIPFGSISGTVTPAASAASVFAVQGTDTIGTALADITTGAYSIPTLPPGTYTVVAKAVGFQNGVVDNVLVGDSQNVVGIDFTLSP